MIHEVVPGTEVCICVDTGYGRNRKREFTNFTRVERVTRTLIVCEDGSRWYLSDGVGYGQRKRGESWKRQRLVVATDRERHAHERVELAERIGERLAFGSRDRPWRLIGSLKHRVSTQAMRELDEAIGRILSADGAIIVRDDS